MKTSIETNQLLSRAVTVIRYAAAGGRPAERSATIRLILVVLLPFVFCSSNGALGDDFPPTRFAGAVGAFAKQDRRDGIPTGGIVFVGSSSIARMEREKVFPHHEMTLRGLRGGQISDLNHYIDQLVLKYKPKKVFFFCGGNDLWTGDSPEKVVADFKQFSSLLFKALPECKLTQLAIRPSPKKRSIIDKVLKANAMLQEFAESDERITFLRGSCDEFLDENGQPIGSLYADDRNHMNDKGYKIWTKIVTPLLGPPTAPNHSER